jgi:hypothetical protein
LPAPASIHLAFIVHRRDGVRDASHASNRMPARRRVSKRRISRSEDPSRVPRWFSGTVIGAFPAQRIDWKPPTPYSTVVWRVGQNRTFYRLPAAGKQGCNCPDFLRVELSPPSVN